MSITTQITRIQTARNAIRTKLISLGIIKDSAASLEACQEAIESIENHGEVNVILDTESSVAPVVPGYYKGGEVKVVTQEKTATSNGEIVPDAGKVLSRVVVEVNNAPKLQSKTVTPTKTQQPITPDAGFDGLALVDVEAIPDAYQDVSGVTATAEDVLANKIIVTADGKVVAGSMINNGAVSATIDGLTTTEYTIPKGYHPGTGKITLTDDIENALASI